MLRIRIAILCGLFLAAAGCETRVGEFTAISIDHIDAKNLNINKLARKEGCEGKKTWFLGIGANLKEPLMMAMKSGDGNLIIDAAVYYEDSFLFTGFRVRGTVMDVPESGSSASLPHQMGGAPTPAMSAQP
jgi:hypothetical protein